MVPVFDFSRLIGFAKTVLLTIAVWTALKILIIGVVTILVPYAIYKAWTLIGEKSMAFLSTTISGQPWEGTVIQLTGLAGWMGSRLQLQQCFQIAVTFILLRYALSFVKKGN